MAECQDLFDYTQAALTAIEGGLSAARLGPYRTLASGDQQLAMQFYLWNARLAKAFLYPLQIAEVVTRNSIHRALSAAYAQDWLFTQPFQLTAESDQSLRRAIGRFPAMPSPDQLVAALTFDFWSNLFRKEYQAIWTQPLLLAVFPHGPASMTRGSVQKVVASVNWFRNRIAHHEPILQLPHRDNLDKTLELIEYSSPQMRTWTEKHSTVMSIVRSPPTSAWSRPGRPLVSTNIRPPTVISGTDKLTKVLGLVSTARPALALVKTDESYIAITASMLGTYVSERCIEGGGMIDLEEHTVDQVREAIPTIPLATISQVASTTDVMTLFFPPGKKRDRPHVVVVLDENENAVGALVRPDVRY